MKCKLVTIGVITSLLVCLAIIALWARGYWMRDSVWYSTDTKRYSLHSYRGQIWFWTLTVTPSPTGFVWTTQARMRAGWLWDSTPDTFYDQLRKQSPKGNLPPEVFLAAASSGGVDRRRLGFGYAQSNRWLPVAQLSVGYPTARSFAIYCPHWALAMLFALPPGAAILRLMRTRRRRIRGLCRVCGYDLRASPDRCPECGEVPPKARM